MRLPSQQNLVPGAIAAVCLGLAAAMFWDRLPIGTSAALAYLGASVALMARLRGHARALAALRLTNAIVVGLALVLPMYYLRDYLAHAELRLVRQEAVRSTAARKCYTLRELRTVFYLVAPDPKRYGGPVPAVVLLHGANGSGAEIIRDTEWDRLVQQKGWLLIVPTSPGQTWSSDAHEVVIAALNDAAKRFPIEPSRILLTGRSDGATWCYDVGLRYPEAFRAIAAVAGAFPPLARLHVRRSQGTAVYIYHSVRDPIFPVASARRAAGLLDRAGHQVIYYEDRKGGHEYSPNQAQRIAHWFETLECSCASGRRTTVSP